MTCWQRVFCVKESSNWYEQGITNEILAPEYLHVYNADEFEVLWSSLVDVKANKIVKETNIKGSLTSEGHFS